MESLGEMDSALQFYEMAQDYLSLVRVYCYCGNMDKVEVLCFMHLLWFIVTVYFTFTLTSDDNIEPLHGRHHMSWVNIPIFYWNSM